MTRHRSRCPRLACLSLMAVLSANGCARTYLLPFEALDEAGRLARSGVPKRRIAVAALPPSDAPEAPGPCLRYARLPPPVPHRPSEMVEVRLADSRTER